MKKVYFSLEDEALFTSYDAFRVYSKDREYADQQDYKWTALVYPDCESYANGRTAEDILNIVRNWGYQEWAYILHDKDVKADGTPKKPHYHIVIKSQPTKLSTIARTLGIPTNYVQRVKSWKKMCQYLIHDETTEKTQYLIEEVVCWDTTAFLKNFDSNTEEEDARKILDYILESGCQSYIQLLSWCCQMGLYATCRRNASMWSNCIREMQKYGHKEE